MDSSLRFENRNKDKREGFTFRRKVRSEAKMGNDIGNYNGRKQVEGNCSEMIDWRSSISFQEKRVR